MILGKCTVKYQKLYNLVADITTIFGDFEVKIIETEKILTSEDYDEMHQKITDAIKKSKIIKVQSE